MASPDPSIFQFGEFSLDVDRRLLFDANGDAVPLMPKAFDTLAFLVGNSGRVVSKDELLSSVWADSIVEENNLTQNISILRRVLGEKRGEHRYIATVPGRGYKFVAEVVEVSATEREAASETLRDPEGIGDVSAPRAVQKVQREIGGGRSTRYRLGAALVVVAVFAAIVAWQIWPQASDSQIRSLAVLPFTNASPNADTDYLSEAIAESVINSLSLVTDLRVISRNSTFRYREMQSDSRAVGSQLGVEAIVTGDIRQVGEDLVINVRLIRASDDTQIWGQQYVKRPVDLVGIQSEIAQAVAQNLRVRLSSTESSLIAKRETENFEAWELYHRGRFHVFRLTPNDVQKGLDYFRQAIAIDPNYALAYTGISDAYRSLTLSVEMPPVEYLKMSKEASMRAIALDENSSEGHSSLGMTSFWGDWNWAEAERRYVRAVELNPNNAMAHLFHAHLSSNLGRHDDALSRVRKARELDPVFPFSNALEGQFLLHAGKVDEAIERLGKTTDIAPNFWMPHLFIASAYIEKGDFERAVTSARKASELSPVQTTSLANEAFALAKAGRTKEAEAILDKLLERSRERFVPPYHFAIIYYGLGDVEKTFEWLEKGIEARDPKMTFLFVEPKWKDLQSDPRYVSLIERMRFELR